MKDKCDSNTLKPVSDFLLSINDESKQIKT